MGNPHGGDAWQFAGKSNRTSSRKIYSACRHCLLSISGVALLRKTGERSRLPYVTDLKKELRSRIVLESTENKQKKKPPQKPSVVNVRWVVTIMAVSFVLSVVMSYISNEALNSAGTVLSFVVLFFFIGLGIVFDMIGVAATSGTEKEFHSMAAHKVRGAREAVWMVRNAEKVSSICNDVVGDICGIISGATGALIVTHITAGTDGATKVLVSLLLTGLISAGTIGGKAAGKGIAVAASGKVLALCGRVLSVLPLKLDNKR